MTPRQAFLQACALDVAVRKPGNVSLASAGHGMAAAQFCTSAAVSAGPLFRPGVAVGERIEQAVAATWAAVGCNTNLGILLLCAPLAAAAEALALPASEAAWRAALERVLADLSVADAAAAYRGIAMANPGGLGRSGAQDVHSAPTVDLRNAMALAAGRDRIARQYRDGFAELFEAAQQLRCSGAMALPWSDMAAGLPEPVDATLAPPQVAAGAPIARAVQWLYLHLLATAPDSHIVRKHGGGVAQNVMDSAQAWLARAAGAPALERDPGFAAWDASLKSAGINPGTSADLTVATLMLLGLMSTPAGEPACRWHGT